MFVVNKSLFKGMNPNDKLTESLNILNSVKQLRDETKSLAESGPEFDYDYSDREVILVDEDGKKTRIDINDLEDLDLDAVGTKLKMYFETKPENYDPTLVNLVSLVNETKIEGSGPDGKSAYEIAVENGFVGTEEEWLKSLHGKNADDLYQSAVNNGYKGTFDEWIKDLFNKTMIRCNANVVDKQIVNGKWTQLDFVFLSGTESLINHSTFVVPSSGLYGISISGSDSFNGLTSGLFFIKYKINGVDSFTQRNISTEGYFPSGTVFRWFEKDDIISVEFFSTVDLTSINKSNDLRIEFALLSNTQGVDGKSAYEIAIENGFVGTEEEWLESLKVPPIPFPVGQNGQSIFNKLTGSQEYSADFICKFFPVASNTEELDKLLKEEFSFEAVFNNWYRFSHGGDYKYPYLPSELNSWVYDSNNKSIKSTINSDSYIGFTSFDKFTKYDIDLTLKSTDADDDVIGFVIAFLKDDTREYTLSLVRSCGGIPPVRNAIIYNYLQPDQKILVDTSSFDNLKNGSNSGIWWSSFSNGTRIKCKREQNIIKVDVSQFNSTEFDSNLSMEFDLSSDPLTTKFMGGASYGFSCFSQNNSYFKINESTNSENVIIDQPNNIVYTYSYANSQWVQASNDFKSTIITEGRFIYSNFNNKFYFVKDGKLVQLMSELRDLIIAEMKDYIDAKIITMESVETAIDNKLNKFLPEVLNDVDKKIEDFSLTLPDIVTEISNKLIEEAIKNLPTPENGKSAYDIAVEEGFVGTKEEWIASLHGKDAKNFYQSAIEEGYEGTFEEWIEGMFSKTTVRCSGHLKSTVIPADTLVTVTPIYENGQSDLIQGNLFTAPVDGLYCLSFGMVYGPNNAKYCASFISSGNKNISCIYVSTWNTFPSLTGIAWLNKGESFSIQFKSSSTQPNITESTFEFALLSAREGKSAYEIAVEEGFIGTKEEWIASLHGKDAKNFYQSAVEEGYEGTFNEWIKGMFSKTIVRCGGKFKPITLSSGSTATLTPIYENGESDLIQGNNFIAPIDGLYCLSSSMMYGSANTNWCASFIRAPGRNISGIYAASTNTFPSLTGIAWLNKGESFNFQLASSSAQSVDSYSFEFALLSTRDGKSAYDIALENGFSGTESEWLESLKGKDAKNFYQSAVEEGFTGTFDEWIKSLFKESIVRCSGDIKDTTITSYVNTTVNLTADDGDISLAKNNRIYAPIDGLYVFFVPALMSSSNASGANAIVKYDIDDKELQIARHVLYNDTVFPSLICIAWLKKGESLSFIIASTSNSVYRPANSTRFEFALISPQKGDKGEKGDKGDPSIGEPSYYPVGWQQVLGLTDDIVTTENEIWLKCNGQRINKDEYPDLMLTNSVVPSVNDLGDSLIATMTSNNSPSPQVASASTEYSSLFSSYKAFDGIVTNINNGNCWSSKNTYNSTTGLPISGDGDWLQIDMGNIISFNVFSISLYQMVSELVNFDLLISDNGTEFNLVKSFQDVKWKTQTQIFCLNEHYKARYIRLLIRKTLDSAQACIGEFYLYNQEIYDVINIPLVNNQYTYVKAKDISKNTNSTKNIGEIFWWPLNIPPDDSLYCNGAEISRFTYKDLYEVIGTSYGEGNGTDTFNLPDLRGEFIRGYDSDNIRDLEESRSIGTHQEGTEIPYINCWNDSNKSSIYYGISNNNTPTMISPKNTDKLGTMGRLGIATQTAINSAEYPTNFTTRPTNVNLLPCIRFKTEKIRIIPGILSNIEYASNDDLTDNDNILTIISNEQGSPGIKRNLTASISKTIKFNTPYNPNTDILELQTSFDRINWNELKSAILTPDSKTIEVLNITSDSGIGILTTKDNIKIIYGMNRVVGISWGTINSDWYWRIVKKTFAKSSVNIIDSPHLWEPNKEYIFNDGSCGQRFVGEISVEAGTKYYQKLNSSIKYIIDVGGEYYSGSRYVTVHSNLSECSDTIARNESNEVFFDSYSSYTRTNAKYDIWMKYIKE